MGALYVSHYLPLIFGIQVVGGVLLLVNRFVPLALAILAPVIVNILCFHVLMAPSGLPLALIVAVLGAYLRGCSAGVCCSRPTSTAGARRDGPGMRRSDAAQNERKIAIKTLAESVPAVIRDTYSRRYLIADASARATFPWKTTRLRPLMNWRYRFTAASGLGLVTKSFSDVQGARYRGGSEHTAQIASLEETTMSHSISTLLIPNLRDVFRENDPQRRRAAIDEIYTEDVVFYDPARVPTVAATRSITSQVLSRRLIPTLAISQLPSPRRLAMGGGLRVRAALAMRRRRRNISSSPGTAGLPPFIFSSISCREPGPR